jgi:hypothetical protein
MSTTETRLGAPPAAVPTRRPGIPTWMPLTAFVLLVVGVARGAANPISDPDAWWHLRVGREIWSGNWSLTDTGSMSSFATEEWIPRDWIPQLVASKFEDWFGLPGVAWLYGAALVGFVVCGYLACRRQADPLPALLATTLATIGANDSLSQRPQLVSFILMFVFTSAWLQSAQDLKPRWWLVPLTWLWACSHGMWYCGIAVGVAVVAGLVLDRRVTRAQVKRLAAVPVLGILVAALTPAGPGLLLTAFETSGKWDFVTEWGAPSFLSTAPAATIGMVLLVALSWARRATRISWTSLGLLLLATAWALMAARTVALAAVLMAPIVAGVIQSWLYGGAPDRPRRSELLTVTAAAVTCLVGLAVAVPATASSAGGVPDRLSAQMDRMPPGTPILNEYTLGGWLHWRHPELQTVIDGFTDGYSLSDLQEYGTVVSVAPGWEEYVEDRGLRTALLPADSPLAFALTDRLGWTELGEDEGFVLLRAPGE